MNSPTHEELLDGFLAFAAERSLALYPHQEEALLELLDGSNVILNTPTGTGKSLVAAAAHYVALAQGRRSFYTAPTKALVSEKFLALREDFGADQVGMITGDGSTNPHAPIIACTAEILAYAVLREGADCPADVVIMDEFHYYGDPERGWAWQVPLLHLPRAQFLLMSATLGNLDFIRADLTRRTGRNCALVAGAGRAVPLKYQYRETPLLESIHELLERDLAPVYVVYFTQRDAFSAAQAFASLDVLTAEQRAASREVIQDFPFDTPIGKDLRRLVGLGIGVHHGGLLPKYRLMMEQLAGRGLLKLICGTDTLGVGINVPIRTVLLTQLCRFDGSDTRLLSAREFHQIAGRAGRKGFDTEGHVWVQAPAHWIDNKQAEEKAAAKAAGGAGGKGGGRGRPRKVAKKRPPDKNYVHWNADIYQRLVDGEPEPLTSNFGVDHHILLSLLNRPDDNCLAVKEFLRDNHEPRRQQRQHIRKAVSLYRSLKQAGLVIELESAKATGDSESAPATPTAKPVKSVRVAPELQHDFTLTHPLSLFAVEALSVLRPEHHGEVLSVIESVLENPWQILRAQQDFHKKLALEQMKAAGLDYEQRIDKLERVTYPKPLADFLIPAFHIFRQNHPWAEDDRIEPKSIAREMFETQLGFSDYIRRYDLKRSEGQLLRYLGDVYRSLRQNIPAELELEIGGSVRDGKDGAGDGGDENQSLSVDALCDWLHDLIQSVDTNVLSDLETLSFETADEDEPDGIDLFQIQRGVRQILFRWVEALARRDYQAIPAPLSAQGAERALLPYWEEHDEILIDAAARGPQLFVLEGLEALGKASGSDATELPVLRARQTLCDPQGWHEWELQAEVKVDPATGQLEFSCLAIVNQGAASQSAD